jgi:prepilin-type N-terminal cleavage/methylation domain-containing protein
MLKILSNKKGFTLIELIVVFTVIAILSTIGTVSLVSYSRTQTLNQATSDLVQTLNTAKSLSASQLKTLNKNGKTWQCLDTETLSGYGVGINKTGNGGYNYYLYIRCAANEITHNNTSVEWQTKFPSDVIFDQNLTTATDIFFPVLSGGIITTGGNKVILKSVYGGILSKTINLQNGYISTTSP